jgi:hypothetical protein
VQRHTIAQVPVVEVPLVLLVMEMMDRMHQIIPMVGQAANLVVALLARVVMVGLQELIIYQEELMSLTE